VNSTEVTLAEILKAHGYHTHAFVGGFPLDHRFGLNQGFDVYNDLFPREKNRSLDFRSERSADAVVDAVTSTKLAEPFFLWVHFYDPHTPYFHGGYQGEIEFVDQKVGHLMKGIEAFRPIVAVAGDHGESLGEHGEYTHRIFVYDSVMHVPFWIVGPGVPSQRVKSQVRLIDFLPTILTLMKIPLPQNLDGAVLPGKAGATALMESLFPQLQLGWSPLRAVRTNEWKWIDAPRPELYHLQSDPKELQNVYAKHPGTVRELRAKMPKTQDGASSSAITPEMAEQLAALGYVSGKTNEGGSGIDPKDGILVWNQIEMAVDLEKASTAQTIAILEKARAKDPGNPMVLGFLAQKYGETGRWNEAIKILKDVLAKDTKNSLALFRMATISLKLGQASEAKRWAGLLRDLEPKNPDAWLLLARSHEKMGELGAAAQALRQTLSIDPLDTELRNDLANLYLQLGDREAAQKEFVAVLGSDKRNIQALNGLATCAFLREDLVESEKHLEEARRIAPEDSQTKMNLALLYSKLGRIPEAILLYRDVADSPNTPADWRAEAQSRLKDLEK
jgi:tetratricopeptide (TPR) repeat protein